MVTLTDAEAAYIAGFVDGEGTINVLVAKANSGTSKRYIVEMSIGQIDPRPLIFIKEKIGGTLCLARENKQKNQKPIWFYCIQGVAFDDAIHSIYKFLILKKDKADIAIQMRNLLRNNKKGGKLTNDETNFRLSLVTKAKSFSQ